MLDQYWAAHYADVRAQMEALGPKAKDHSQLKAPAAAQSQKWDDVNILPDGAGRWVVPRDWYSLHYEPFTRGPCDRALREALQGALGPEDCLQYTFGNRRLVGRMINDDPDVLEFNLL